MAFSSLTSSTQTADAFEIETPIDSTERSKWYGDYKKGQQPPYKNKYPIFQRPPNETPLLFEDIDDWETFKQDFVIPIRYPLITTVQKQEERQALQEEMQRGRWMHL